MIRGKQINLFKKVTFNSRKQEKQVGEQGAFKKGRPNKCTI